MDQATQLLKLAHRDSPKTDKQQKLLNIPTKRKPIPPAELDTVTTSVGNKKLGWW